MAIPKIIHYCWFGDRPIPLVEQECIATWKLHLKDYEFMFWKEENIDLNIPFVKYAYENKMWAYVSDYIRLKVIQDYGGIYLDTDMYVVKNFDPLLSAECFFGAESVSRISCGIIGAEKHNFFIKKCLDYYEEIQNFNRSLFKNPITKIVSGIFRKHFNYIDLFEENIYIKGLTIYKQQYFYPISYSEFKTPMVTNIEKYTSPETYAVHLWSGSWQGTNEFRLIANGKYFRGICFLLKYRELRKIRDKKYLQKLIKAYKISKPPKIG